IAVPRCGELARVRGEPDGCDGVCRDDMGEPVKDGCKQKQVIDACVALSDDFGSRDWTMCIITPALYQIM
ncbi:unnamed protein product, partial [Musa textilis]